MIHKNEYYESMKWMLIVIRILGIFPYGFSYTDGRVEKYFSSMSAAIVVGYFVMMVEHIQFMYLALMSSFVHIHFDFEDFVDVLPLIVIRFYAITVPFSLWNESKILQQHLNHWFECQIMLEKIAGSQDVVKSIRNKIKSISVLGVAFGVVALHLILELMYPNELFTSLRLTYYHSALVWYSTLVYWLCNSVFTKSIAEKIQLVIWISVIESNSCKINQLTSLWTKVCNQMSDFNLIHCGLFLTHFSFTAFICIITSYTSMAFHLEKSSTFALFMLDFSSSLLFFFFVYVYIEEAHQLHQKIKSELQSMLIDINTVKMNRKVLHEVWRFLHYTETKNPNVILNGCLRIDRTLVTGIASVAVNYLIVLRQFNLAPQPNEAGQNMNNTSMESTLLGD